MVGKMHRRQTLPQGQQGQALLLTIILLAVAALVASPVLIFVSAMLLGQLHTEDNTRALLAADAGLEAVMADLVRGADAVTTTYPLPVVSVNQFTPTITITTPTAQATPFPKQQYFDPGLQDPDLLTIPSQTGYLIHLYDVQPSSDTYSSTLAVNWAFSPVSPGRVGVWKDGAAYRTPGRITSFPTEQPVLDTGRAGGSTDFISIPELIIDTPGVYTIAVFNTSSNPAITVT
ncbi:MAG: hypothetical protein Q8R28_00830, partial [Dehalococcoidia bacterium]|nr:hypothetical protein [Dehalococcoidia bacterium]